MISDFFLGKTVQERIRERIITICIAYPYKEKMRERRSH